MGISKKETHVPVIYKGASCVTQEEEKKYKLQEDSEGVEEIESWPMS